MSCTELSDQEILKIVEPMADAIMMGAAHRDYAGHTSNFSVNLKSRITSEVFLEACEQRESEWGAAGPRGLICIFRKEKSFTVLWNQPYDRTDDQVALLVTVALKGGRYFVDHLLIH